MSKMYFAGDGVREVAFRKIENKHRLFLFIKSRILLNDLVKEQIVKVMLKAKQRTNII